MTGIGILLVGCGIFLLVYGGKLFRLALAIGIFVLGFNLMAWLLASQPVAIRLLISIVVGAVLAVIGYTLVKMVLHIAGGLLGAVLVLLFFSLLRIALPDFLVVIFVLAGTGLVGFFGNRFGDWVIILATTLAGAYAILLGMVRIFPEALGVGADYVSAQIPTTGPSIFVFLVFLAIGVLAQLEIRRVRGRYVNLR